MRTLHEAEAQREGLEREIALLEERSPASLTPGQRERLKNLRAALASVSDELAEREAEHARLRAMACDPHHLEPAALGRERIFPMSTTRTDVQEEAVRSIDRLYEDGEIGEDAGQRLVDLVDADRVMGVEARYIHAVSSPAYSRAFHKKLFGGNGAESALTAEESEAVALVGRSMAERAMLVGEDAKGGFALPAQVDPTFQLASDGALSPLRQLASVVATTASEWKGVTTEGTTAEFAAEGEEVGDGTPTLKGPKLRPQRAHGFCPFSIEMGQDLGTLNAELTRLFADAKDTLEAEKFLAGKGSKENEPSGLLNEVPEGSVVETKVKETLGVDDVYAMIEKLPPRWQPRAGWLSSLTIANVIHRFSGPGSEEPPLFNGDRTQLLGKRWSEVSDMAVTLTGGNQVLVYGDLSQFKIADRLGMTAELIPHLMGEEGRPLGMRGLYVIWRTTSALLIPSAVRVLTTKK